MENQSQPHLRWIAKTPPLRPDRDRLGDVDTDPVPCSKRTESPRTPSTWSTIASPDPHAAARHASPNINVYRIGVPNKAQKTPSESHHARLGLGLVATQADVRTLRSTDIATSTNRRPPKNTRNRHPSRTCGPSSGGADRGTLSRFGGDVNCLYQTIDPIDKVAKISLVLIVRLTMVASALSSWAMWWFRWAR